MPGQRWVGKPTQPESRTATRPSFLTSRIRYLTPHNLSWASIGVGAILQSFFFTFGLAILTGNNTDVCKVSVSGSGASTCDTTPCHCETLINDGPEGAFPSYANHVVQLALGLAGLRVFGMILFGAWTRGEVTIEHTIMRGVMSFVTEDEPRNWRGILAAIVGQVIGAAGAAFLTWGYYGGNKDYDAEMTDAGFYRQTGHGVGSPGIPYISAISPPVTAILSILLITLGRHLVFLFTYLENQWKAHYFVGDDGKPQNPTHPTNPTYGDMVPQFINFAGRALFIGLSEFFFVLATAKYVGTAGYWIQDLFRLLFRSGDNGNPDKATIANEYVLTLAWPLITIALGIVIFCFSIYMIKYSNDAYRRAFQ